MIACALRAFSELGSDSEAMEPVLGPDAADDVSGDASNAADVQSADQLELTPRDIAAAERASL
jgi:hypothetical protein